uniref:Sulfotransferase n=1 Tax=Bubo bubo TaxID=30461 RepID=A0A8C0FBM1_BUBBB
MNTHWHSSQTPAGSCLFRSSLPAAVTQESDLPQGTSETLLPQTFALWDSSVLYKHGVICCLFHDISQHFAGLLEAKVFSKSTHYEVFLDCRGSVYDNILSLIKKKNIKQGSNKKVSFSGTVWTQNILSLIIHEGHRNGTENMETMERIPWLEYRTENRDYAALPLPRVFATHLPYYLLPRDLRNKRGRVSDVVFTISLKPIMSFCLSELVQILPFSSFSCPCLGINITCFVYVGSSWLDHVAGWYSHAEDFNILFVTYEEMKKDLRSAVLKICNFLGKKLSEEEVDSVVRQATFENMRKDPRANYENLPDDIVEKNKGSFLRKGIVGDWKNIMTVAQNERFDKVLTEKMKTLPIKFIWDINDEI